jgi:hypothetical protein
MVFPAVSSSSLRALSLATARNGPQPQSKLECNLLSRSSTRNLQRAAEGSSPPRLRDTILLHSCPDGQCAPSTVRRSPYWKKHSSWPVRDHSPRRPANGQDLCLVGVVSKHSAVGVARDHELTNIRVRLSRLFQHRYGFRTVARTREGNPKIFPLKKRKANLNRSLSKRASQPMKACSQILPTSLPLQGRRRDRLVVDWCQSRHSDLTQLDWSRGTSQVKGRKLRTAGS